MSELLEEYRYGERGVLVPGSLFKVAKGPYYVTADGERVSMAEKGKFKFHRYDPRGWILAHRVEGADVGGLSVLHVGKTHKSKQIAGLIVRGYSIKRPKAKRGDDIDMLAVDEGAKEGHCSVHPTYQAIRRPRVNCPECIVLFEAKNPGKLAVKVPREKKAKAPKARSLAPDPEAFVARLKAVRKEKKLSCSAFGALAGLSGAAISMLETGKAKLTHKLFSKLSPVVNA